MKGRRFIRAETPRLLRLGKKRRQLLKWRRPKGTHSKVRKQRFGHPLSPAIGYKRKDAVRGLVKGKIPIHVSNLRELEQVKPHSLVVLSRTLGAKKRTELIKYAHEKKILLVGVREAAA